MKRILLLYISEDSGHHCASLAIEHALKSIDPSVETLNINCFNYTNPILEKVINRAYMSVIKAKPEIWDYLYDNPNVLKNTQKLRDMIHRFNAGKLNTLIGEFKPDAVVCTQAFPCGMIADFKKSLGLTMPLVGVLTDYAPHSYWIYNNVDSYIVPSDQSGKKLIDNGIEPEKIKVYGIPIDSKFSQRVDEESVCRKLNLDNGVPRILIMGGTQGLGPIKEVVRLLDKSHLKVQAVIVTGTNKKLFKWLTKCRFRKKMMVLSYVPNIDELMSVASLIITKPGGITTAEALAKGLPMLIISPLPGQEAMNTTFLLKEGVAVKAQNPQDIVILLEELLYNKNKLKAMSDKALSLSKPDSAVNIAKLILELTGR